MKEKLVMGGLILLALGLAIYSGFSDLTSDAPKATASSSAASAGAANALPAAPAVPSLATPLTDSVAMARGADLVQAKCSDGAEPCDCQRAALLEAFERRLARAGREIAEALPSECREAAVGMIAEAYARDRDPARAMQLADQAAPAKDPYATYARALSLYQQGDPKGALAGSAEAAKLGRGATALVLSGLIHYQQKDFERAEAAFSEALRLDAKSAEAVYNMAVLDQRRNRYREAREGYLKALRIDPAFADARYNLAVLTLSAGATMEAKHHYEKFRALAGDGDARVAALSSKLGTPQKAAGFSTHTVERAPAASAK
jgi:tetratricopeptide (TPR) repeat protein